MRLATLRRRRRDCISPAVTVSAFRASVLPRWPISRAALDDKDIVLTISRHPVVAGRDHIVTPAVMRSYKPVQLVGADPKRPGADDLGNTCNLARKRVARADK